MPKVYHYASGALDTLTATSPETVTIETFENGAVPTVPS